MGRRLAGLVGLLVSLSVAPVAAQLAPLGAPSGVLRIDIRGSFESADSRFAGSGTEDYLADFGGNIFGGNRIPLLHPADTLLAAALGQPGYGMSLGAMKARGQLTVGTGTIGAALGLTRKLTVFANVPLVTTRVQANFQFDSTPGDAGFNPAHPTYGTSAGQQLATSFFQDFTLALVQLNQRIQQGFGGNTSDSLDAVALLQEGQALQGQLQAVTSDVLTASPFLPTATSAAGQALVQRVSAYQTGLSGYGVSFTGAPVLAAGRLDQGDVTGFLNDPTGPIQAIPLAEAKLSRAGDMDVGAIYTLIDRFDRPGTTGGLRLAVQALVRLPTGLRDDPNNLLDVGTGNGRYEVGASGTLDVGSRKWGLRVSGGYLARLEGFRVRRVSAASAPYAEFGRLANVRLNAGDVVSLEARPFYRLARNLALTGVASWWRSGKDQAQYDRARDSLPGIPASVLGTAEGSTALLLGGGLTYVGRAAHECEDGRRCGFPIEASWQYGTVVSASGAPVPRYRTTRLEIRWYQRLWR